MMHGDMKLYQDRLHYTTITTTSFNRRAVTGKEFVSVALVYSESLMCRYTPDNGVPLL